MNFKFVTLLILLISVSSAFSVIPSNSFSENIVNPDKTFQFQFLRQGGSDTFSINLKNFTFDRQTKTYFYNNDSIFLKFNNKTFAELKNLNVEFKISDPYKIRFSYFLKTGYCDDGKLLGFSKISEAGFNNSFQRYVLKSGQIGELPLFESFPKFKVKLGISPVSVPYGHYKGRVINEEYAGESIYDDDSVLHKRAINYSSLHDSMARFFTSSGLFQGTYRYLYCDSDGCSISVGLQYPNFWGWEDIWTGDLSKFWIVSQWEGSYGDDFSSYNEFTITQD